MPAVNIRTFTMLEISRSEERLRRGRAYIESGLRHGFFRPVVDRVFELGEVVKAHEYMEAGGQFGKIVLRVDH
jgi:NADPH:quinone reductase-like Zn-dependent oxidoreductase